MSEGRGLRQSTRFQQRALSKLCGGRLRDNSPAVADELWARDCEIRSALGAHCGDVSRRRHNGVARDETGDTNLVC
jgi:hypothetical protein